VQYFTPQLFVKLQECQDQTQFRAVNAEWERAVQQYRARLQELAPGVKGGLRRFLRGTSLHDAQVLDVGTSERRLTIALQQETGPGLLWLSYSLVDAPVIDRAAFPEEHRSTPTVWLYDEIDRDPRRLYNVKLRVQADSSECLPGTGEAEGWRPIFLHSVLLSNGWEIRLRFHRLSVTQTTSLLNPTTRAEPSGEDLSRSA
jgi:hypothetical protein